MTQAEYLAAPTFTECLAWAFVASTYGPERWTVRKDRGSIGDWVARPIPVPPSP